MGSVNSRSAHADRTNRMRLDALTATGLVVSSAAAIILFGYYIKVRSQQRLMEMDVEKIGGSIAYNDSGQPETIMFSKANVTDKQLASVRLSALTSVRHVAFTDECISDGALQTISRMRHLESVIIHGGSFSARGVAHLGDLAHLTNLCLASRSIGDEELGVIGAIPTLRSLNLSSSSISDRGLASLIGLDELDFLNLSSTRVTNDGIRSLLLSLPNLSEVVVPSNLSVESKNNLRREFPKIRVRYD